MGHNLEFNAIALSKKIDAQTKLAQIVFPDVSDPNDRMMNWSNDNEHGYAAIFHQLIEEDDHDLAAYLENSNDTEAGKRLAAKIKTKVLAAAH